MLDAAFPPAPSDLLADLDQVGAGACAVYVWGGAARGWTPAHVAALRRAGKYLLPIVVPGDSPPQDTGPILAAAAAFGFPSGPLMTDYETASAPPVSWAWAWEEAQRQAGYRPEDYGTRTELGLYPPADAEWIANWIRTGVMDPVPALPAGQLAWQFVDDVVLAHGTYDVSVVAAALFEPLAAAGGDMSIALRPDGSGLLDWFEAEGLDRHCAHRVLNPGQSIAAVGENIEGASFIPGSFRAWWNSTTTVLTVMGQVDGGAWWAVGWNGAWGTWLPTGISTAVPAAATYVRHSHQSQTDTGTPVG